MDNKDPSIRRRDFLQQTGKLAAGVMALQLTTPSVQASSALGGKKKLAMVGTGMRGTQNWGRDLLSGYGDYVELVGFCDINPKRVLLAPKFCGVDAPTYVADKFENMIRDTKPDAVIVTTTDCFHVPYAIQAMELGTDVICEKPLAITAKQCNDLLATERRTGRKVTTAFNARHGNSEEEIKRVLLSGALGPIISATFEEYLDVDHGASYFRRWHGKKKYSGSLLCHKASHHFDQMNWWLDAEPVEVHAFGKVAFYGSNHAFRSERCRGCQFSKQCDFYWDISSDPRSMELYVACEGEDGYYRDGCVWDKQIDSYDSMTVEVLYSNGALLSYTLNAFLPYEGQRIAFNGVRGRLDAQLFDRQPWEVKSAADFRQTMSLGGTKTWQVQPGEGEHGGADVRLKDLLFKPDVADPFNKLADSRAGVMASLIGIAARQSIETQQRVKIADLVNFKTLDS
jgi:predicted dehydrogenase